MVSEVDPAIMGRFMGLSQTGLNRYCNATDLNCSALQCSVVQCTALHCTALHRTALHITVQHDMHYTTLHYAEGCIVLHSTHQCTNLTYAVPVDHCAAVVRSHPSSVGDHALSISCCSKGFTDRPRSQSAGCNWLSVWESLKGRFGGGNGGNRR